MATDSNNKKILVVEDNEDSRRLVCKVLKLHGYSVIGVDNGEDAIIQAQNELPDLVPYGCAAPRRHRRVGGHPAHKDHAANKAHHHSGADSQCQARRYAGSPKCRLQRLLRRKPIDIDELPQQVAEYIARASSKA